MMLSYDAGNKYLSDERIVPPTVAQHNLLIVSTLTRGARTLIHINHACNFYSLNDKLIEIYTYNTNLMKKLSQFYKFYIAQCNI